MFKKIDKLILRAYIGPFLLTFAVVLFMFLVQYMIKNFKHFVGKDIELGVFAELFAYFSFVMTPVALPLAVLLSCLMTFGSLGEHSEITAIKGAGISLLRILRPIAVFILFVTGALFVYNDTVVPAANLKAYSLLWDIKQTKPTLDLKEGVFYTGLEDYRIKVDRKDRNGRDLEGVLIYNHQRNKGNVDVIIAENGQMENIGNKFMVMNLQNGTHYSEVSALRVDPNSKIEYVTQDFDSARFLFSLEEFELVDTPEELFGGHNLMKNNSQLAYERDSLIETLATTIYDIPKKVKLQYFYKEFATPDTTTNQKEGATSEGEASITPITDQPSFQLTSFQQNTDSNTRLNKVESDSTVKVQKEEDAALREIVTALNKASGIRRVVDQNIYRRQTMQRQLAGYTLDIHKKYVSAIAVFIMFLIGAPLGAIIKKGGLGVPVLVSILFFIVFYISTIMGTKFAKEQVIIPEVGAWFANALLLVFGLFFLRQAKNDARLFDYDYYFVVISNLFKKGKS